MGKTEETARARARGSVAPEPEVRRRLSLRRETDLLDEQTVLCGVRVFLAKFGFETLVEAGYQREIAYSGVCHKLELVVDLVCQGDLSYLRYSGSDTSEYANRTGDSGSLAIWSRGKRSKLPQRFRMVTLSQSGFWRIRLAELGSM